MLRVGECAQLVVHVVAPVNDTFRQLHLRDDQPQRQDDHLDVGVVQWRPPQETVRIASRWCVRLNERHVSELMVISEKHMPLPQSLSVS